MTLNIQKDAFMTRTLKENTQTSRKAPVPAPSADQPKNSTAHVNKLNTDIEAVQLTERTLVSHLKDCRTIMDQIKDKADNSTEELSKVLLDNFSQVAARFKAQVEEQTKENERMLQKVERLKQEKAELQKVVMECAKRCSALEEELGKYPC